MAKPAAKKTKARAEKKPKLTDAERHRRFVDMVREVEASDDPQTFDEAFSQVLSRAKESSRKP
jgi:hypothetical protein